MKILSCIVFAASVFSTLAAVAQSTTTKTAPDYPKFEVPVGFSFVNVHPNQALITSFNVFSGGAGFVYNFTPLIGIKGDFMGTPKAPARGLVKTVNSWEM